MSTVLVVSQKAPSAKRCIKTPADRDVPGVVLRGQKAPSAKRCIKTREACRLDDLVSLSESTERQKVH